ncbi:MAG TPA: hypothetical protein VFL62_26760, partial [Bradyrhizobium sp.]|uniref:hypothetical protein n=1 Tax=Bradyrhizobium sp. TaxID=376 RepID=UPI002D806219
MEARKLRLGFLLAAGAIALAFVLPLAPEIFPLTSRPAMSALAGAAGLLFLLAAWLANDRSTVFALIGA